MEEYTRNGIEQAWKDFLDAPSVQSQLPLYHSVRPKAVLEALNGGCVRCDQPISGERFRGLIRKPFQAVYSVSAFVYCEPCNLLSPVGFSIHETETFFYLKPKPFNHPARRESSAEVVKMENKNDLSS